jgi:low density lipoprotein-related protein 2
MIEGSGPKTFGSDVSGSGSATLHEMFIFPLTRPGFRLVDNGTTCVETENPYLMVIKKSQIVDLSVKPEDEAIGHLTPVVDLKFGRSVDYDTTKQLIYWTEMDNDADVNGTLYMSNIGGGDKVNFFDEFDTGMVGSPYAIAFDWVGRNLYIVNQGWKILEQHC